MVLLVTGGAGFIGSNFIHYILNKYSRYEVVNLDLLTYAGNLNNLLDLTRNSHYSLFYGDIADPKLVFRLVKQVDVIVHFAAESHVDRSILDDDSFLHTNIKGTLTLLKAAKKYAKRFHHISTDEVFGSLGFDDPRFNEQTPYNPRSPYSASKAAADHLVRAYYHTHQVPITISNCSNNYGSYAHPEKMIPLFVTNLIEGKKVPLYGNGINIRDWIHVLDHCRGIDLILHHGKIGETYCLGGDLEISNIKLTKKILELMGYDDKMIEHVPDRPGHDLRYAIDFSKARNELGFEPKINFLEGLRETIDWYKKNDWWWKTLKKKTK